MSTGNRGRATAELITRMVPNLTQLPVYLCGPNEMMDATNELLIKLGVPFSNVHTEAFASKKSSGTKSVIEIARSDDFAAVTSETMGSTMPMQLAKSGTATIHFSRSGNSTQIEDALSGTEKSSRVILACQARPQSDVNVESWCLYSSLIVFDVY